MIHSLMILANFEVFSLMVTDGHTDGRMDGHTDIRTDRPSYRDARTHLKKKERKTITGERKRRALSNVLKIKLSSP